jgi:hypothetical protein
MRGNSLFVFGLMLAGIISPPEVAAQYWLPGAVKPVGATKVNGKEIRVYNSGNFVYISTDSAAGVAVQMPVGAVGTFANHIEQSTGVTAGRVTYGDGTTQWGSWDVNGAFTLTGQRTAATSVMTAVVNGQVWAERMDLPATPH